MKTRHLSYRQRLREIWMFFQGKDEVYKTMRRLAKRLEKAQIPYAIMGGMAVNAHGHHRTTGDVDMLLTAEGLNEFRQRFVPKDYEPVPKRSRRFVDRKNGITVDFLITGLFPGGGKPGPISFPSPEQAAETIENFKVIDLATLIQLKLAARRHQDFADVVNLIRTHDLHESFQEKLHQSLHRDYIECLDEKRREDEYVERNG